MKKIITAINNPKLNEELKKEKNFEVIGKDIQYKEAILEILEKNKDINIIIINEKLPGEIKIEILIEKIKLINKKVKIIFILEKENSILEKNLVKNKIIDIYYNDKIDLKKLIEIINKKEISMEEEIFKLRKIIEEKEMNHLKMEKKIVKDNFQKTQKCLKDRKKNLDKRINRKNIKIRNYERKENNKNMLTKIISISGNYKSGKSTLALIISHYLSEKKYKVLLIDGDLEKEDLSLILKKEKFEKEDKKGFKNCNIKSKTFYKNLNQVKFRSKKFFHRNKKIIKNNKQLKSKEKKIRIKKDLIYFYYIKRIIRMNISKINKNLYFLNGLEEILKITKIKNMNIILKILKQDYSFILIELSKSNQDEINQNILKKSQINFLVLESNLLGIREIKKVLKKYIEKWEINQKTLEIILNKKNMMSMNKNLITKIFEFKIKVLEVKENKIFYLLINNFYKGKVLLKNAKIKADIKKIVKNILYFNDKKEKFNKNNE